MTKKKRQIDYEGIVERSNIYKEDGFVVNAFAANEIIGKLAILRRHDKKKYVFCLQLIQDFNL